MKKPDWEHNALLAAVSRRMNRRQRAILALGHQLQSEKYRFVTPSPLTHHRVLVRPGSGSFQARDFFGWNRPVTLDAISADYRALLEEGTLLLAEDGLVRSAIRFSTLDGQLFAHSGFPTVARDAVFFGPDSYRFVRAIAAIKSRYPDFSPQTLFDVGAGSGVGGICAAATFPSLASLQLGDISGVALELAGVNSVLNGVGTTCVQSDLLTGFSGQADLVISNPPYLVDPSRRAYRHGGGDWGTELSRAIVEQALQRLAPGGCLLLYTGAPVVAGEDQFLTTILPLLKSRQIGFEYEEIDPDVFGEELENPPYDRAERIAAVCLFVKARKDAVTL